MAQMETKMRELINKLNEASDAYYNGRDEIMSNKEWDAMFDELRHMEMESGIVFPDSPTQNVGAEINESSKLPKVKHEFPATSLDKTKDVTQIVKQMKKGCDTTMRDHRKFVTMMWKEDGSTAVVTYENGELTCLATRGNGEIGSDATIHAAVIHGLPLTIPYKGHAVFRGEVIMSYETFHRINDELEAAGEECYKNPRNLANATIQLTDTEIVKSRNLEFIGFELVHLEDESCFSDLGTFSTRLKLMDKFGFKTVERIVCVPEDIEKWVNAPFFDSNLYEYPVDGLVIAFEDHELAKAQPATGHHPHVWNGYALKWRDETEETIVRDIIWSDGRTGVMTPVVVFDPVELEGTTVTRASMHNLGLLAEKDIKIGDRVTIFKANKIIPQVDVNYDAKSVDIDTMNLNEVFTRYNIPTSCPECGSNLRVLKTDNATLLTCANSACPAKVIGNIVHFCSRDCMDIQGMSNAKIEHLVTNGFISNPYGLYHCLHEFETTGEVTSYKLDKPELILSKCEGWGESSVSNMIDAIKKSKDTTFVRFLASLGIDKCGKGQAKLLAPAIIKWQEERNINESYFHSLIKMRKEGYDFTSVDGIGEIIADNLGGYIDHYFIMPRDIDDTTWQMRLLDELTFIDSKEDYIKDTSGSAIAGKVFVITGSVNHYTNRDALKAEIEALGGKVTGSVTKKTDYLINNDTESTSGKNKKAKELSVAIISEDDYRTLAGIMD